MARRNKNLAAIVEAKRERQKFVKSCANKKRFKTQEDAEAFIKFQWETYQFEVKWYNCQYCFAYHLTTQGTENGRKALQDT